VEALVAVVDDVRAGGSSWWLHRRDRRVARAAAAGATVTGCHTLLDGRSEATGAYPSRW
jgi:hypothetical protein